MAKWECFDNNHPLGTYSDISNRVLFALEFHFFLARNRMVNVLLLSRLKEMIDDFIHMEDTDVGNGIKFLYSSTELTFKLSPMILFNDRYHFILKWRQVFNPG